LNVRQFIALIRIPSLTATIVPLLVGGIIARRAGSFSLLFWILMFVASLSMQIGVNVFNEHGDFIKGIDRTVSHGFAGVIVSGQATASEILFIAILFYIISAIIAIPLVLYRGALILIMGLAASIVGVLYSEGPLPLSATPFGEIFVGLVMGLMEIIATEFVSCGRITYLAYLTSVPISILVASILVANNIRDIDKDREAGRKTLVVIMGARYSRIIYYGMILLSYCWLPIMYLLTRRIFINLPLLTLPIAVLGFIMLRKNGWKLGVEISSAIYLLYGITLAVSIL
ncbi:MAG: UbiA family prenyltransferase, partial [Thermoplasmatales archaeon]